LSTVTPHNAPLVQQAPAEAIAVRSIRQVLRDYLELTKPEISFLVTVSAFAGFLLGSPGELAGWTLFFTLIGTGLTAAGVGALNHCLEWELDARMRRTAERPIPAGRIPLGHARIFGALLVMAGIGILCPLTNPLTGVLAALTVVLYLYVYTPLKRRTKYNTLIGTLPGALPALGGWTAATGNLGAGGWSIFLILALWQMPHFLALAWMYRKDYARGEFAMLTVLEPEGRSTAFQTLFFTVALVAVSVLPTVLGLTGWLYLTGALLLGVDFLVPSWSFFQSRSPQDARRVLMASIRYIPLLVALILADRFI
jgi:heme o synthase